MLGTKAAGYALPFEVVSMLLLAAMIGCIVIAMKAPGSATSGKAKEEKLETIKEASEIEITINEITGT